MEVKHIYSKYFPLKGYLALTFYPWIFIREDLKHEYNDRIERHEITHALQQLETLWGLFLIIYGLEYIVKLPFCHFNFSKVYQSISFEQEANEHEAETYYNDVRKHYAWIKYIFKLR